MAVKSCKIVKRGSSTFGSKVACKCDGKIQSIDKCDGSLMTDPMGSNYDGKGFAVIMRDKDPDKGQIFQLNVPFKEAKSTVAALRSRGGKSAAALVKLRKTKKRRR